MSLLLLVLNLNRKTVVVYLTGLRVTVTTDPTGGGQHGTVYCLITHYTFPV